MDEGFAVLYSLWDDTIHVKINNIFWPRSSRLELIKFNGHLNYNLLKIYK